MANEQLTFLNDLFSNPKNIQEVVGNIKPANKFVVPQALRTVGKYIPVAGDVYDVTAGINKIKSGHPYIGTAQAGIGTLGLGLDTLAGIAAATGVGAPISAGGLAAKEFGKQIIKKGGKELLKSAGKNYYKNFAKRGIASLGLEGLNAIKNDNEDYNDIVNNIQPQSEQQIQQPINNGIDYGNKPTKSIEQLLNDYYNTQSNISPVESSTTDVNEQGNINNQNVDQQALNDLLAIYNKQLEYSRPYQEALANYLNNYPELQRQAAKRDQILTGISIMSNSNAPLGLVGKYNPSEIEATQLDLLNKLLQSKQAEETGYNQMIGNAAIAQEAGLPLESILASPDIFKLGTAYLGKQQANDIALQKAQLNNANRMEIEKLKTARALSIAEGNWDNRKEIAYQNYLGRLGGAMAGAVGYGANPLDVYAAINMINNGGVYNRPQTPNDAVAGNTGFIDPAAEFSKAKK